MKYLFYQNINLEYVNFRNIKTNSLINMEEMFLGCSKLKYINLYSFREIRSINISNIFEGTSTNFTYCISDESHLPAIYKLLRSRNRDCSQNCYKELKVLNDNNQCISICFLNSTFEYNNTCYSVCPIRTKISPKNNYSCIDIICEINFNYNQTFCLDYLPDGYFINDTVIKTIDKCHDNCKECNGKGTDIFQNCTSCYYPKILNSGNCIPICSEEYLINNSNDNINEEDKCLITIKKEFSKGSMDYLLLKLINGEKKSLEIQHEKVLYQFITSENINNNKDNNYSTFNFSECELKLKTHYNISLNESLLIFKIEVFKSGYIIPIIAYEVYNSKTKQQLKLIHCKDKKINLNIPVDIEDNKLFIYNKKSDIIMIYVLLLQKIMELIYVYMIEKLNLITIIYHYVKQIVIMKDIYLKQKRHYVIAQLKMKCL